MADATIRERPRVLVSEKIADAGVERLRSIADVDVELALSRTELLARIGDYDGIVVRSATMVDRELIEAGGRLTVVGRAGTGVDNVDVEAATSRGIVVANAPQSNSLSAAEHAIALMMALARNIPQAHAALVDGRWERSRFGGVELEGKWLAVLGFGRIGQLVAQRARALGMHVRAYDPFVSADVYERRGAERAATIGEAVDDADFVTLHLPSTPETRRIAGEALFRGMKRGARIITAARGDLVDEADLLAALESGQLAGAALDVFSAEPMTSSPLFGRPDVVVTPHLGASTREAQDRAGTQIAEEVAAALTGGVVGNAVNVPVVSEADRAVVAPFLSLAERLGRTAASLAVGGVSSVAIEYAGGLAEHDTRLLTLSVLCGLLRSAEPSVNLVNARSLARERGIAVSDGSREAGGYTNLIRVALSPEVRVSGVVGARDDRPWLVRAMGYEVEIELVGNMVFLLNEDRPGMIGKIGTALGDVGMNIANMNVSRNRDHHRALCAIQTDGALPRDAVSALEAIDGCTRVRSVSFVD